MSRVVIRLDATKLPPGPHKLRLRVDDAEGRTAFSLPAKVFVWNPQPKDTIVITATDEDVWDIARRSTNQGKKNRLEVDHDVGVTVNGVQK